jgi:hypothetical protein
MSNPRKRNRKTQIGEPFVAILKHMIAAPAFQRLTNASRVAYLLLKAQVKKNGQQEVIFPYSHAEPYMDRHTFSRSIKQLVKLGFIEKSDFGGLYRRTNVYKFIESWRKIK